MPSADGPAAGRSLRIVAADSDPAACRLYHEALTRGGHQVTVVGTGQALVEACRAVRPDLVLAEVQAPGLDGVAAADEICRAEPTPFLLVAGSQQAGSIERALANGCLMGVLS